MAKLIVLAAAICMCLHVVAISNEDKIDPPKTMMIPPFMELLKMVQLEWFIRNVSMLDDKQCNRDLYLTLNALDKNEIWAKQMLDASSHIESGTIHGNGLFIGNFDECIWTKPKNVNFSTQYCLISVDYEVEYKTNGLGYVRSPFLKMGQCLPSTCKIEYLNKIFRQLKVPNTDELSELVIDIKEGDCKMENEEIPFTTLNYVTMGILLSLATLVLTSTIYELTDINKNSSEKLHIIVNSFSIVKNFKQTMMYGAQRGKPDIFLGIKTFSCLYLINFHTVYLSAMYNADNQNFWDMFLYNSNKYWSFYTNMFMSIDNFFFVSGTLIVIVFFKKLKSQGAYNPMENIVKRYFNIMFPMFLLILIRMGISEHLGDGPVYNSINNNYYKKICEGSVWPTVLLYHNYLYAPHKMCFQQSWYLPVDIHLYAISHIVLLVAYRSKKIGFYLSVAMMLIGCIIEFLVAYIYDLAPSNLLDPDLVIHAYAYTHVRLTTWFAGMAFGFIVLYIQKKKIRLAISTQLLFWIICLASFFASTMPMLYFDFKTAPQPYSALYLSCHRLTWSIFLGWLILACNEGYAVTLSNITSFKFINFLGNLSFELFIVHVLVIEYFLATTRNNVYVSVQRGVYHTIPITWFSIILSIIFALTFTSPLRKLTTHYFDDMKLFSMFKIKYQTTDCKSESNEINLT